MLRQLVSYLHDHGQKYILVVDPARDRASHPPFERTAEDSILLRGPDGKLFEGVVWHGVSVFPDWFSKASRGTGTASLSGSLMIMGLIVTGFGAGHLISKNSIG